MSEDGKFIETGLKNLATVAAFANPILGGAFAAAATLAGLANWFAGDDTKRRLKDLEAELGKLRQEVDRLRESFAEFVVESAAAHNEARYQDLVAKILAMQQVFEKLATDDPDYVACAIELGVIADWFIQNDMEGRPYAPFLWYDVGQRPLKYPDGEPILDEAGRQKTEADFLPNRFKNLPTLPFYVTALAAWLAVRELVVDSGELRQLAGDRARLDRHLAATRVRSDFQVFEQFYRLRLRGNPDALSITELIMLHIRSEAVISTRYRGTTGFAAITTGSSTA